MITIQMIGSCVVREGLAASDRLLYNIFIYVVCKSEYIVRIHVKTKEIALIQSSFSAS